jgi:hypothetical protein
MNTGYLIYQAERPRSTTEQRQVDIAHAELARSVSRRWQALTAPLRGRRLTGRRAGRRAGFAAEYQATEYQATEYQATEYQATECLSGRRA